MLRILLRWPVRYDKEGIGLTWHELRASPHRRLLIFACYASASRTILPPSIITMVRLITHNLLACHAKGCTSNNFPLQIKDAQVELREAEFNADFLRGFMPKIEWGALVDAAKQVGGIQLCSSVSNSCICGQVGGHFIARWDSRDGWWRVPQVITSCPIGGAFFFRVSSLTMHFTSYIRCTSKKGLWLAPIVGMYTPFWMEYLTWYASEHFRLCTILIPLIVIGRTWNRLISRHEV